ncbi:hypothetical protein ABK040_007807 [Willaertia magna]
MSFNNSDACTNDVSELFKTVAAFYNPTGEEEKLIKWITEWMTKHSFGQNLVLSKNDTGLIYKIQSTNQNDNRDGVLLMCHLDSDHLADSEEEASNIEWKEENDKLYFNLDGDIGLDDKTGVTVILNTLLKIEELKKQNKLDRTIYILFSVQEEVGQKGVFRIPKETLADIVNECSFVIAVDRMSLRHPLQQRHAVVNYRKVPTVIPTHHPTFVNSLDIAAKKIGEEQGVDGIDSDFCSDILEIRIRVDSEIIAPKLIDTCQNEEFKEKLQNVLDKYNEITNEISDAISKLKPIERVSGYHDYPRANRYAIAKQLHELIYKDNLEIYKSCLNGKYDISCLNLSLDYDEDNHYISLKELYNTSLILLHFITQQL